MEKHAVRDRFEAIMAQILADEIRREGLELQALLDEFSKPVEVHPGDAGRTIVEFAGLTQRLIRHLAKMGALSYRDAEEINSTVGGIAMHLLIGETTNGLAELVKVSQDPMRDDLVRQVAFHAADVLTDLGLVYMIGA